MINKQQEEEEEVVNEKEDTRLHQEAQQHNTTDIEANTNQLEEPEVTDQT